MDSPLAVHGQQNKLQLSFSHHRLSTPRSIRLLTLLPCISFDGPLLTQLAEVPLDDDPEKPDRVEYEALSYVWGARVGTEPLTCNGQILLITPNCESALRHLRRRNKLRVLWVDAICIDQGDDQESWNERNSQVALMGEVYAKAARTICWLGTGNEFTGDLMKLLGGIGACPTQRGLRKFMHFDEQLRKAGKLDYETSSLDHILAQPWHSRIWTVQEVAYSQDCVVHCGSVSMSWDNYSRAIKFLVFDNFLEQTSVQSDKSNIAIDVRNVLRDYVRGHPFSQSISEPEEDEDETDRHVVFLSSCLTDLNQLQATDAKDKIYGLHAIYTSLGIPLPEVDYTKSLAEVYEGATIAMISWSRTLRVLGDVCRTGQVASFPSWVPDWSDSKSEISAPRGDATAGSKIRNSSKAVLNPVSGKLHVQGKMIGTVAAWPAHQMIGNFPTRADQRVDLEFSEEAVDLVGDVEFIRLWILKIRFLRQFFVLLKTNKNYCGDSDIEDTLYDLLRQKSFSEPDDTFYALLDILQYPQTTYDLADAAALVEKWGPIGPGQRNAWPVESINCAIIVASLISGQAVSHNHGSVGSEDILEMLGQFSTNLIDKTLIRVKYRQMRRATIGTSIRITQPGDAVVLLEGAEWPVILRQEGLMYRFIGPAFIVGMMDGEAWSDKSNSQNDMNPFVLV